MWYSNENYCYVSFEWCVVFSAQELRLRNAITLYFLHMATISGSWQSSPSILYIPSTITMIFFQGLCVLGCPSAICSLKTFSRCDGAKGKTQNMATHKKIFREFIMLGVRIPIQLTVMLEDSNCSSRSTSTIDNWVMVQWVTNNQPTLQMNAMNEGSSHMKE